MFRRSDESRARRAVEHEQFETKMALLKARRALKQAKHALKTADKPVLTLSGNTDLLDPSVRVYHDRIELRKETHELTADLTARVEGTGRHLFVVIEGPDWGYTNDSHDAGKAAHDFAMNFNRLVAATPIASAEVTAARSAVEDAVATLERLEAEVVEATSR